MVTQYDAAVISIYLPGARGHSPETKTEIYDQLRTIAFCSQIMRFAPVMTDADSSARAFPI